MELKSMALSKAESEKMAGEAAPESDGPRYPYGLTLNLDNETIEKLGLATPQVGAKLMLEATVVVESASEHQRQGDEKQRSVTLQVTEMAVAPKPERDAAKTLFGSE